MLATQRFPAEQPAWLTVRDSSLCAFECRLLDVTRACGTLSQSARDTTGSQAGPERVEGSVQIPISRRVCSKSSSVCSTCCRGATASFDGIGPAGAAGAGPVMLRGSDGESAAVRVDLIAAETGARVQTVARKRRPIGRESLCFSRSLSSYTRIPETVHTLRQPFLGLLAPLHSSQSLSP